MDVVDAWMLIFAAKPLKSVESTAPRSYPFGIEPRTRSRRAAAINMVWEFFGAPSAGIAIFNG
jgi:hypothetical protein